MQTMTIEKLIAATQQLEVDVPSIRGSFPDLAQVDKMLRHGSQRQASYVLGTIKSGKSTLLSAILAADVLPRGSGVRTFNLSRISAAPMGEPSKASVQFKTAEQLVRMLQFDFRILGCDVVVPVDPYSPAAVATLQNHHAQFEAAAAADGRLQRLQMGEDSQGFLQLALTRLKLVINCLAKLHSDVSAEALSALRSNYILEYAGHAFNGYLSWANSLEYAVLIQEIHLHLAFPQDLLPTQQWVDCQGSDSLNPLDFAAVDAALHRADRILYVVNSRLGLRVADKSLLTHVQTAGLAAKTIFVFNVEAFEPVSAQELAGLLQKFTSDLQSLKLDAAKVCPVVGLLALRQRTQHADADLIRSIWQNRGELAVLQALEQDFQTLLTVAQQQQDEGEGVTEQRVASALVWRAKTTAQALMARDKRVLGVEGTELKQKEVQEAISRILTGERVELQKQLTQKAHATFDSFAPLQQEINAWIKAGIEPIQRAHALPLEFCTMHQATTVEASMHQHAPIIAAALEVFNTDWTIFDQKLRVSYVRPFVDECFRLITQSVVHLYKVIPGVIGQRFSDLSQHALPPLKQVLGILQVEMERYQSQAPMQEILRPVLLLPVVESGLITEFYARKFWSLVKAKLTRKAGPEATERRKIELLWNKTLQHAFKAAVQDQGFSVSSARENFKFQFLAQAVNLMLERFEALMMTSMTYYFADVERLQARQHLLLTGADRRKLEDYLESLTKGFEV